MKETDKKYRWVAIRCLYNRPIRPNFKLIALNSDELRHLINCTRSERIKAFMPYLKDDPKLSIIRDICYLPLNYLRDDEKNELIDLLQHI